MVSERLRNRSENVNINVNKSVDAKNTKNIEKKVEQEPATDSEGTSPTELPAKPVDGAGSGLMLRLAIPTDRKSPVKKEKKENILKINDNEPTFSMITRESRKRAASFSVASKPKIPEYLTTTLGFSEPDKALEAVEFDAAKSLSELCNFGRSETERSVLNLSPLKKKMAVFSTNTTGTDHDPNLEDESNTLSLAHYLLSLSSLSTTNFPVKPSRPRSCSLSILEDTLAHPYIDDIGFVSPKKKQSVDDEKRFIGIYSPKGRRERIQKFFEKRKSRMWTKKVQYDVRKNFADKRIRIKGRFVKREEEPNPDSNSTEKSEIKVEEAEDL